MKKKLVVISIDALGSEDLMGDLSEFPTLQKLVQSGTHIQEVKGVYPTLTYPSHTTIVTGVYPNKHGIVNNTKIQPTCESPDWFWYKKAVQVPTLYDCAKNEGKTTAAFLWPVTARSGIHWNIAEIFPNRIWTNQVLVSMSASSPYFIYQMNKKYGHLRQGLKQPQLDDFVTACAVDTLRTKKPDLTLIHLVDMDSMRHMFGVRSKEAREALKRQDKRVAQLIEATKVAGTFEETTFAILGDHYQIDVSRSIRLNRLFAEKGWLNVSEKGTVQKDWQVLAKSCDGSCYVYKNPKSPILPKEIFDTIKEIEGVEVVLNNWQLKQTGADSTALFMLEGKAGYYFTDETQGALIEETKNFEIGLSNRYKAVHGFSPEKARYATTIVFVGENIAKGRVLPEARLIDEAPTFAKILGLTTFPKEVDGVILEDIFETNKD